ncbi:MAG: hypothetical protein IT341_10000 [Chloroflexi bacterium]|nr:hypothetical protein [Chloroflexota bacterium]
MTATDVLDAAQELGLPQREAVLSWPTALPAQRANEAGPRLVNLRALLQAVCQPSAPSQPTKGSAGNAVPSDACPCRNRIDHPDHIHP